MNRNFRSVLRWTLITVLLAGCATETETHLIDAAAALEACDLREAHGHFDLAYASDPAHPDAALGFALTDAVMLMEDPNLTAGLAEIGFTAPLDSERLWGADGILARLRRGESCESVSSFFESSIPYRPLRESGVDGGDLIRPDLEMQDLIGHLTGMDARFERLASAFETAASGMGDREVTLDGGCGVGRMVVQAPELYAAAAVFVLIRAVLAIAPTYDWSMRVHDLFLGEASVSIDALQTLFSVVDAGAAENARPLLIRSLRLFDSALAAAEGISSAPADATFDWATLDRTLMGDLRLMSQRAISSLEMRRSETIPYMTPATDIDVSRFLSSPPDQASLAAPLWSLETDYISTNGDSFNDLLSPYFTGGLFDGTSSIEWTVGDRWSEVDFEPLLDPGNRYEMLYNCSP